MYFIPLYIMFCCSNESMICWGMLFPHTLKDAQTTFQPIQTNLPICGGDEITWVCRIDGRGCSVVLRSVIAVIDVYCANSRSCA